MTLLGIMHICILLHLSFYVEGCHVDHMPLPPLQSYCLFCLLLPSRWCDLDSKFAGIYLWPSYYDTLPFPATQLPVHTSYCASEHEAGAATLYRTQTTPWLECPVSWLHYMN